MRGCGTDQTWDGQDFQCQVKTCNTPREVQNGKYSPVLEEEEEYVYMSSVTYDCDYCHQAKEELTFTCTDKLVVWGIPASFIALKIQKKTRLI